MNRLYDEPLYCSGETVNNWEIIKVYPGKRTWKYDIKCLTCGETIRTSITQSVFKTLGKQCNRCAIIERNIKDRTLKIGDSIGKLTIIGDAGYKKRNDGKRRHYSWVQCDCGSAPFQAMDNCILNHNINSCGCLVSKGEFAIRSFLEKNNINFKREYSFPDLISPYSTRPLRFDFAIFTKNNLFYCLIEFDGRQHFTGPDTNYWGHSTDTLEMIQKKDNLKNQYCKTNNIKLIRIKYAQLIHIDSILTKELKEVMPNDEE